MARKKIDYNLLEDIDPSKVPGLYETGKLNGLDFQPEFTKKFLAKLKTPLFGITAFDLADTGAGKLSTPYKFIMKYELEWGKMEPQTGPDCVSHSTRNAGMISYGVGCATEGQEYKGRFSTEQLYGSRKHSGAGAACSILAAYTYNPGGFLVRSKYTNGNDTIDLSKYNYRIGAAWGSRGVPTWLTKIAHENPSVTVSMIKTVAEARDAIANGYGISVCSNFGFSSTRNKDGVSEARGVWNHGMCWCGCDDTEWAHINYGGMLILIQNSWGAFNSGPTRHDQPPGSFWIRESVAQRMLNQDGAWCISDVVGYPRRKLDYNLI